MAETERPVAAEPESGRPAEVTPAPPMAAPEPPSEEAMVAQVVQVLVSAIGIKGRVEVSKDRDGYLADVRTRRSGGLLIGHRGSTLRAIQHVARAIVRKRYPDVPPINVDVGGYRLRREGFLRKKATAVARIVIETKREMALDFLTERELEVVRDAIVELPVRAYAVGTGSRRNVVIAPVLNQ